MITTIRAAGLTPIKTWEETTSPESITLVGL